MLVGRLTESLAGWILTYLVHSTVILAAAWLIASRRRVSDSVRDVLWKSAIVGGIVTATIQMSATRAPLGGQWRLAGRITPPSAAKVRILVTPARLEPQRSKLRLVAVPPWAPGWTIALVPIFVAAAGVGLLWFAFASTRTNAILEDRESLDRTPLDVRLEMLRQRAGIDDAIRLTASDAIASPVALAGDEVCLPRRALLELTPAEQDSMLAHEVAHLVRRDPQWLVVARVIELVFFFQPLNRLARHRMQEVAEYLCDDWAVERTSRPVNLAKCLAAVAEWVRRGPSASGPRLHPMSAMVETGGSPLVRRVSRILSDRSAPHTRTGRVAFAVSVCALAAFAGIVPRVSVARAMPGPRFTFLRERVNVSAGARRDTVILFRRLTEGGPLPDSIGSGVLWTRRVVQRADGTFEPPQLIVVAPPS
jgi:beta-lactamase regulating signal transducer with metallopeptidase domain